MKALMISNMYPSKDQPSYGIFVKNFESGMKKEGFVFDKKVIISGRGRNIYIKILRYLIFTYNTIRLIKKYDFDIIYVHYVLHSTIPLIIIQKLIKRTLILNAHGSDIFPKNIAEKILQRFSIPLIRKADLFIVPSEYFKNIVHDKFKIPEKKIFVSPSGGINTLLFRPNGNRRSKKKIFGYVSRIDKGKGWEILLKSVKLLINDSLESIDFEVVIVGDGSQKIKLFQMINELYLGEHIKFFGIVPHERLAFIYNQMDILIFPSTGESESLGLVGLEAMACGIPVIGSYSSGLKTYIKEGYNGKFFKAGSHKDLYRAIKEFMELEERERYEYKMNSILTAKKYDSIEVNRMLKRKILNVMAR